MRNLINGGPAFPATTHNDGDMNVQDEFGSLLPPDWRQTYPGMTLRDWFAGRAMQGLLAAWGHHDVEDFREIASDAYNVADAMLVERAKEQA